MEEINWYEDYARKNWEDFCRTYHIDPKIDIAEQYRKRKEAEREAFMRENGMA